MADNYDACILNCSAIQTINQFYFGGGFVRLVKTTEGREEEEEQEK